eukprot:TRINITY_DN63396_c0_g1_i1.p1 TRINITY_DN63396_c0_g1~~TRINITY_DN63396_c0_g1_i1.p1  ORF type:complete len:361 (-),score=33.05 TRINITY_DN63396_c0_g1_i1:501-1511(-)
MECCFAFLRRTEAGSLERTAGLRGQGSSHSKSLILEKTQKGLSADESPSRLTSNLRLSLSKLCPLQKLSTRSSAHVAHRCELEYGCSPSASIASTKANAADVYRDDRNDEDVSSARSCSSPGSSSEDDVPVSSLLFKARHSEGDVTCFRRWTDPKSLAAHDSVRTVKSEVLKICGKDHASVVEARRFDPLLVAPSRSQRRVLCVRSHAEEAFAFKRVGDNVASRNVRVDDGNKDTPPQATPTSFKDAGSNRANTPLSVNQSRPELNVTVMQDRMPKDVVRYTHKRTRPVRLLFSLGHSMHMPEPTIEVAVTQQSMPIGVSRFTHRRSRTAYVRDGL